MALAVAVAAEVGNEGGMEGGCGGGATGIVFHAASRAPLARTGTKVRGDGGARLHQVTHHHSITHRDSLRRVIVW